MEQQSRQDSLSRSGAFEKPVDERMEAFSESVSFDARLFCEDIAGSMAHARMLRAQGILTDDELAQIERALSEIGQQLERGSLPLKTELEDIHMNIEQALIDRLGDVGRKLHTGRSRNDQVATDTRLWVRSAIDEIDRLLEEVQKAFIELADEEGFQIIPAYTHLQRAQPVLFAHYLLAWCEKFERDRERLADCRRRVNRSSLGTAALAGTSLPIDRDATARELGFEGLMENSLDSSSDRDYVLEFVFCLATISLHLSSWAEDWILWSTVEFNMIRLPQEFCTGSSIMPQKINPDVLELTRGKSARVVGSLTTLMVLVKGLPMAYNRDLQEDKPALFDAYDTVRDVLALAAPLIRGARLSRQNIAERLELGFLDATTLMEFLIRRGVPQRKAHHLVGELVRLAASKSGRLADLSLKDFQAFDPTLDDSIYDVLGVANAVRAFQSYGSTGPDRVASQLDRWKLRLNMGGDGRSPASSPPS